MKTYLNPPRICIMPRLNGVGGMVSFQRRLTEGLIRRGVDVCFDLSDTPYQAVLVIGGTHLLHGLWRVRRKGIRIVQRLNGMNWLHRVRHTGLRHFLRSEYGNLVLSLIRSRLADWVVYQSEFARDWWEHVHGETRIPHVVIYNGVDLNVYHPHGPGERPCKVIRVLIVEGNLMGGYEQGLEVGMSLVEAMSRQPVTAHSHSGTEPPMRVELAIAGRVTSELRRRVETILQVHHKTHLLGTSVNWLGVIPYERIPEVDRSAHLLFSADVNSACPNSVIEAMACGTPVIAFATGALPEIVGTQAGRIVPYGGNPWRLDPPDVGALAAAALEVLGNLDDFCIGARARAEHLFDLERMIDSYLQVLLER